MAPLVAVLGRRTVGNDRLVAGLQRLGLDVELVEPTAARGRVRLGDIAIARLDVLPTLDGIEPGLLDLLWLERADIRVANGVRALLATHDKLRTAALLAEARLPHPRTIHVRTVEALAALEPPLVVKPRFGSWGRDVQRCLDRAELGAHAATLAERPWFRRHGVLAQELLPSTGRDLRLVVAGREVVGAVERAAAPGEWRTNVSLGGTIRATLPSPAASALAVAAARACGADLVGVDLLPLDSGDLVVLELNGAVEFDGRYSLAGSDVYAELARALALGEPTTDFEAAAAVQGNAPR